jgi:HSP20 family molecular chaperone IbpA
MSFLQRLKSKDVVPTTPTDERAEQVDAQKKAAEKAAAANNQVVDQLKVDIFQTPHAILVYAQIAGAGIENYSVIIEGENDIVTIKGDRTRPNGEYFQNTANEEKEQVLAECVWGSFYRQIILPAEVDASKAEAKSVNGVLMLYLPLMVASSKGVRLNVTNL